MPASNRSGQPGFGFSGLALQIGALDLALALAFFAIAPRADATAPIAWSQAWTFMLAFALVHDLRSPASAVLGALDVMVENQGAAGEVDLQVQAVSVAPHAAQRLLNLIDSLMDVARAQSGNLEISLAPVDLRKMLLGVLADFFQQAKEYEVILRNETPVSLPQALADAGKIQRVIANLVDNALKFSPAGGQVAVRVGLHAPDTLEVAVSDSGPGIPFFGNTPLQLRNSYIRYSFEKYARQNAPLVKPQRARYNHASLHVVVCI
jgi:two-component system sensor histidine kinase KdpD